jgi:hypothetical protein
MATRPGVTPAPPPLAEQGWAVRLGRLRWDAFITGWQLELGGKEWSWCWCAEASENAMRERRGRDTGCWCWLLSLSGAELGNVWGARLWAE